MCSHERHKPPCDIDIDLTMDVYTDPKLLDVAGAMESLPALPLSGERGRERLAATGTNPLDGTPSKQRSSLAPLLAPTSDKPATPLSNPVKIASWEPTPRYAKTLVFPRKNKDFRSFLQVGVERFETFDLLHPNVFPRKNKGFRPFLQVGVERFKLSTSCTPSRVRGRRKPHARHAFRQLRSFYETYRIDAIHWE